MNALFPGYNRLIRHFVRFSTVIIGKLYTIGDGGRGRWGEKGKTSGHCGGVPTFSNCVYMFMLLEISVAEGEGLAGTEVDGGDVAFQFGGYGFAVNCHGRSGAVGHEEVEGVGFFGTDVG